MRKLLVLMLIFGIASLANASLVVTTGIIDWEVVGSELIGTGTALGTLNVYLALDVPDYGNPQSVITRSTTPDGTNSDGVWLASGDNGKVVDYVGMWSVIAGDVVGVTQATGEWFRFDITDSSQTIEIWSTGWASLGTIALIPEPTTMALLGLGGLFLRRRKK
jgi:hypothetical protein